MGFRNVTGIVVSNLGPPAGDIAIDNAEAEGTATTVPRSDHVHAFPAVAGASTTVLAGGASGDGVDVAAARADHEHGTVASTAWVGPPGGTEEWLRADGTWDTPPGTLLGIASYGPSPTTTYVVSTNPSVLDSVNLSVPVTVPTSGRLLVRMTACFENASGEGFQWLPYVGGVVPAAAQPTTLKPAAANVILYGASADVLITGLAPGPTTVEFGAVIQGSLGSTASVYVGSGISAATEGPGILQVFAACRNGARPYGPRRPLAHFMASDLRLSGAQRAVAKTSSYSRRFSLSRCRKRGSDQRASGRARSCHDPTTRR